MSTRNQVGNAQEYNHHLNTRRTYASKGTLRECVEFVLAPQHETSCDSEITKKEDFDYWRKIIEESNLEVYRRIHE